MIACIGGLHDAFRPMVLEGLARCQVAGITVEFDDGGCYRSIDEQARLYQRFMQGGPRAAPPGESAHNYGLAVDIHVVDSGRQLWSGPLMEAAMQNFVRAGCVRLPPQYNDPGHLEHPQWRTLAALGNNPVTNPYPPATPPTTPPVAPAAGVPPACR